MIPAKLSRNTKSVIIDNNVYCAYCGKEIQPDTEIDHHEETRYFHCDCEDALKEIEIQDKIVELTDEIVRLNYSIPKPKYKAGKISKLVLQKI